MDVLFKEVSIFWKLRSNEKLYPMNFEERFFISSSNVCIYIYVYKIEECSCLL